MKDKLIKKVSEAKTYYSFKHKQIVKDLEKRLCFNIFPNKPIQYAVKCKTEASAWDDEHYYGNQRWALYLVWGDLEVKFPYEIKCNGDITSEEHRYLIIDALVEHKDLLLEKMAETVKTNIKDFLSAKKFFDGSENMGDLLEL